MRLKGRESAEWKTLENLMKTSESRSELVFLALIQLINFQ